MARVAFVFSGQGSQWPGMGARLLETEAPFRECVVRCSEVTRALLGWSQNELSRKSRVALGTIRRMEGFKGAVGARTETLGKVVSVLEKAGIEFLDNGSPGVRLKPQKR